GVDWHEWTTENDRHGRRRKENGGGRVWRRRRRKSSSKPCAKRECGIRKETRDGWRSSMATKRNWRSFVSGSTKKAITRGLFWTSSMWPNGYGRPAWIFIEKELQSWKTGSRNG